MDEPWYQDGLRFQCTQCGNCCRGAPGNVWVNAAEVKAIAAKLEEPLEEFQGLYTRMNHGRRTLRERADGDCILWDRERGCTVYEVRPRQCRTWPFWESILTDEESWESTKDGCPGMGHGELIPVEEITRRMKVIKL